MLTASSKRQLYSALGSWLQYPAVDTVQQGRDLADRLGPLSGQAWGYLESFLDRTSVMSLSQRQEHYVQTFDLMPQCSLYVSVHLFGEESFKRAELMAGLKRVYDSHGVIDTTELPDHLALLLLNNAHFSDEEWHELVSMAILPAIIKMIDNLDKRDNPYALALKAVRALLIERERVNA